MQMRLLDIEMMAVPEPKMVPVCLLQIVQSLVQTCVRLEKVGASGPVTEELQDAVDGLFQDVLERYKKELDVLPVTAQEMEDCLVLMCVKTRVDKEDLLKDMQYLYVTQYETEKRKLAKCLLVLDWVVK